MGVKRAYANCLFPFIFQLYYCMYYYAINWLFRKIAKFVVKDPENPDELIESFIKEKENIDIGQRDTQHDKNEEEAKLRTLEDNIIDKNKDKDKDKDKEEEKNDEEKKDGKYEPPKDLINEDKKDEKKDEKIEVKDDKKEEKKE